MKEKVTFRSFFSTIKRGVYQVFQWFLKLVGLKEGGRYSRFLRIVVGTCVTIWLVAVTVAFFYSFCEDSIDMAIARAQNPKEFPWSNEKILSSGIVFVKPYCNAKSFLYNHNTGKTILKNVDWVVTSDFGDSLAVFSHKGKRGYINTKTGEITIPAVYERAWLFSEDLAAVQKDGKLVFINRSGDEVLDGDWRANLTYMAPMFRDGYCAVNSSETCKLGIIDKSGVWVIEPEYNYIARYDDFWMLVYKDKYTVLDLNFETLIPGEYVGVTVEDGAILAQPDGAPCRAYDYTGRLINDCVIDRIANFTYKSGIQTSVSDDGCLYERDIIKTTDRLCYRVCFGEYDYRYGMMDHQGHRITEPIYSNIDAIGPDLYLCEPHGIIINGKGQRVE